MYFGPNKERTKAYRPGPAKLLAKRDVTAAANNSAFLISISPMDLCHATSRLIERTNDSYMGYFLRLTLLMDDNYVYYSLSWFMLRRYGKYVATTNLILSLDTS